MEVTLVPKEGQRFTEDDVRAVAAEFPDRDATVKLLSNGRISVRVDGVSAHLLAQQLKIRYGDKEILHPSALTFAYAVMLNDSNTRNARNAACALYKYYQAADTYVSS